jgi:subtilisin family serine protease
MRRSHASGQVTAAQPRALRWEIGSGDSTGNELEVWYDGARRLSVALVTPAGGRLGPVAPDTTRVIRLRGQTVGRIINRLADPNNGDNQIDILLDPSLPKGLWQVELTADGAEPTPFHAWIERDDAGQSAFAAQDNDQTYTLGSISCGARTIVVGAYNATVPGHDLASFSSEGPTRDGRQKPELSAPGVEIKAANSLSQSWTRMSGTSMAAPHVTGVVALLMQAAGPGLPVTDLRQLLASTARPSPAGATGWQRRYGEGRIDAFTALQAQLAPVGQPQPIAMPPQATSPVVLVGNGSAVAGAALAQLVETLSHAARATGSRIRVEIEVEPLQPNAPG